MAEISAVLWDNMIDVLKDVSNILQKEEDAKLSTVKLEDRPKTGESQYKKDPIKGGESSGKPGGEVIVKAEEETSESSEGRGEGGEETKEDTNPEDEKSEEAEKEVGNDGEMKQLMLLLKDIKNALNNDRSVIAKSVLADVQKALPSILANENARMLRKMGFQPSRADITRLGLDDFTGSIQPVGVDIKKSEPEVDTDMTWEQLAIERQKRGGFPLF